MQTNWKPVIKSFVKIALNHGLKLHSVDNGGGNMRTATVAEAVDEINATDEARVYFTCEDGKTRCFFIVLGNSPEETICDYSSFSVFDIVAEEFSAKWYGKECPEMV
jgi:hypothetical protein